MHHLTRTSRNSKTGPIPVSTHTAATCPDGCQLKGNGCFAQSGPIALHWKKVSSGERGGDWVRFCDEIKTLPKGQLWRYAQAGDLIGYGDKIDVSALKLLVRANKNKRGFTYTHKPHTDYNLAAIRAANNNGFTVNLSTDNTSEAVRVVKYGLPVVTLLPLDAPNDQKIDGVRIVACPAQKSDRVSCATCALCADSERPYVIGFRAHGSRKKKVNKIALSNI